MFILGVELFLFYRVIQTYYKKCVVRIKHISGAQVQNL